MEKVILSMPGYIAGQLVTERRGSDLPTGNGFVSVPTAAASSFQVHTTGWGGRAHGAVGEYGIAAFRVGICFSSWR